MEAEIPTAFWRLNSKDTTLTNIAKIEPTAPIMPARADPGMVRLVQATLSGADMGGTVPVLLPGKDLDPDDRRRIEGRLSTLRRSLAHRDNQAAAKALAKLMASYSSARGSTDEARATIAAYVSALADLPPWAVAEACQAWVRGGYGATESAFAPSAEQLHAAAWRIAKHYDDEAKNCELVLSARLTPESPAARERISDGFERLKAELAANLKPMPAADG